MPYLKPGHCCVHCQASLTTFAHQRLFASKAMHLGTSTRDSTPRPGFNQMLFVFRKKVVSVFVSVSPKGPQMRCSHTKATKWSSCFLFVSFNTNPKRVPAKKHAHAHVQIQKPQFIHISTMLRPFDMQRLSNVRRPDTNTERSLSRSVPHCKNISPSHSSGPPSRTGAIEMEMEQKYSKSAKGRFGRKLQTHLSHFLD